jgi:Arc/MetJ-type ribon-helix-helix transcriptional regulator
MSLSLPADLQARVDAQIATGLFQNEEHVLREALATLEQRKWISKLRAMVAEADQDVAVGRIGPFDIDATMSRIEARLSRREA